MKHLTKSRAGIASLVAMIFLTLGPNIAEACPATPPDLEEGDLFRLAFVTSGVRDAESSEIADYNAFVSAAANAVPELVALGTQWFAIASTATVDARDNTDTAPPGDVPVYLLDGTMLAGSYADLWDWSIAVPLNVSELCTTVESNLNIWTGTGGFGTVEQALGTAAPTIGSGSATINQQWVRFGATASSADHRFYAISGVLTITSTPIEGNTWDNVKTFYR
jgi:hypothetical protein|nr:hypothetical protein [Candidatus Krumholzibacteria bacterium]